MNRSAILNSLGIHVVARAQRMFPPQLRTIPDPPSLLYIQGDPSVLMQPAVSIVGSRQSTEYGKRQTRRFTEYLARRGVVIVSGLAYGIDLTAHETAIASGPSVAVIAGGLDVALMSWQEELARRIIKAGGAVISEYPPGEPALKYHFPERNRIIAGLSPVTLIAEARDYSGALITARLAAEAGRSVYCVPHDLGRASAAGSNRLLRDGANVALEPRDVFEELLRHLPEETQLRLLATTKSESSILELLKKPHTQQQLVEQLHRPANEVLRQLVQLEIDGKIFRTGDGRFIQKVDSNRNPS